MAEISGPPHVTCVKESAPDSGAMAAKYRRWIGEICGFVKARCGSDAT
ncbi:hypothetical protein [Streptomyces showdoensis]|nr:hypothetical protein [Streptomyces showdoensis]